MADPTPNELRVLLAVESAGSFSGAAAALGMTQSAVSHAIRTTERRIGAVLFERGRKGATPTAAGTSTLGYARRVLRLLELMGAEARAAAAGPEAGAVPAGPLRIAAFRSAALHLLPPALERLRARHPGIEPVVRVVRELGRGTAGEVLDGRADLGIATMGGSSPVPDGLVGGMLREEEYALVHPALPSGAPDTPAAGLGGELHLVHPGVVGGPGLDPAGDRGGRGRRSGALDGVRRSRHGDHARTVPARSTRLGRDHRSRTGAPDPLRGLCHHP